MRIVKARISNYRCFRNFEIEFPKDVCIIVGDNETGKSTILEAIHLAFTGKLNGRSVFYELTPYHFNKEAIQDYLAQLRNGGSVKPAAPTIEIEIFFDEDESASEFKGKHNSTNENLYGFTFTISINELEFGNEYAEYILDPEPKTIPIEYYSHSWMTFAGDSIGPSVIGLDTTLIDATNSKHDRGPETFIANRIKSLLSPKENAELRLKHRQLKEKFDCEDIVVSVNDRLRSATGDISDKELAYSVDLSSRSSWESGFSTYLDSIPLQMTGKGEQTKVKARLALHRENDETDRLCLIEEPENHLSFSNMSRLIAKIREICEGKQLIITTHSSFVANKLGLSNLILLAAGGNLASLSSLTDDTQKYFKALPGYDTLRVLLSPRPILVEGASDELIVQKAYMSVHGRLPIEDGVDVIAVRGLSFKRFLEIALLLEKPVSVITDNDGDVAALNRKYADFVGFDSISLFWDPDEAYRTLESQLVKANLKNLTPLKSALDVDEDTTADVLIEKMTKSDNKTPNALKIFETEEPITFPAYILDAVA